MKFLKLALCAAPVSLALAALASTPARAETTVAYNIGAATDYVFRGVSQTDENAQIFGGIDATFDTGYVGVWASNVDFGDDTSAEVDLYAGFKPAVGMATLDLGVIYYGYVNAPSGADYANWEVKAAISAPVGMATIGGAIFYSPDSFGAADEATYYEANIAAPAGEKVTVNAVLGRQTYQGGGDYTTWNIGATIALTDHVGLDLRYHDTDEHGFGKLYGSRFVIGLKGTF